MRTRTMLSMVVLALVAAACGGGDGADILGESSPTPAAPQGATVAVASSDLGDILVDGDGMTLYLFVPDAQGEPTCTEACAQNWPPLEGDAEAGQGADASLLGTVDHPSGVTQVTYNDWPLYHFANDQAAGDTNGQGVGGNWYVVDPSGEAIMEGGG